MRSLSEKFVFFGLLILCFIKVLSCFFYYVCDNIISTVVNVLAPVHATVCVWCKRELVKKTKAI